MPFCRSMLQASSILIWMQRAETSCTGGEVYVNMQLQLFCASAFFSPFSLAKAAFLCLSFLRKWTAFCVEASCLHATMNKFPLHSGHVQEPSSYIFFGSGGSSVISLVFPFYLLVITQRVLQQLAPNRK